MTSKKKLTKFIIIFILFVFLFITWLSAIVPYMWGNNNATVTWDLDTWSLNTWSTVESGIVSSTGSDTVITGSVDPVQLTNEEASKKMEQFLSGVNTSPSVK